MADSFPNPNPEYNPEEEQPSEAWIPESEDQSEGETQILPDAEPEPLPFSQDAPAEEPLPDPLTGFKPGLASEPAAEAESGSAPTPEPQPAAAPSPPRASEPYTPAAPAEPLSPQDERTWAMLAHLSILLNLVTGFLGPLAALIIYLVYKDRSRYVAFQSMQAFVFQLVAWVGAGILAGIAWTISGVLAAILIGCLLMPIALVISLVPLAALVYGVVGAVETNQGRDFRYWLVGDWTRGTLK